MWSRGMLGCGRSGVLCWGVWSGIRGVVYMRRYVVYQNSWVVV